MVSILFLLAGSLFGIFFAVFFAKKSGSLFNFRTILLLNYAAVSLLSGVVHLLRIPGVPRGFYDVTSAPPEVALTATLGSLLGLLGLTAGLSLGNFRTERVVPANMSRRSIFAIVIVGVGITPLVFQSLRRVEKIAETANTTRVLFFEAGDARFVYMSQWVVWLIAFAVLFFSSTRLYKSNIFAQTSLLGGVILIATTLSWTGGRAVLIVMTLPLLLTLMAKIRNLKWLLLPALLVVAFFNLVSISNTRFANSTSSSSLFSWLDWEWGRYSMLGFAEQEVESRGYLFGESFAWAFSNVSGGVLKLLGVQPPENGLRSVPSITGEVLLGNDQTYVVAGLNSELFLNFGFTGIVVGLFLLGIITGWVDTKFSKADDLLVRLLWAFVGTLLVFRTLASDGNAFGAFLLYSGSPLLAAVFLSWIFKIAGRRKLSRLTWNTGTGKLPTSKSSAVKKGV